MGHTMVNTILVVDDDPVQRRLLEAALVKKGHVVIKAENGEQALEHINGPHGATIKAIILDLIMPGISGMDVMESLQKAQNNVPVIVQTAQGGIETVVNAMRLGAFDFVVKPVAPERIQAAIGKALKLEGTKSATVKTRRSNKNSFTFKDIVTTNLNMRTVLRTGEKASASHIPVLIEGESGVGKELIAKAIQGSSDRADKPFITVNCGALPENLVESLLFGHEKGAFTGANDKHIGKFEEANGGTLFLDEVGELPLDLQVKLLRAIQEGEIDPVGAKKPVKVDIRIISATNRNLEEEVKAGRFRQDLFYRLNVLPLNIPPLRDRSEDIQALVFHFVKKISVEENRKDICAVNSKLMQMLKAYQWPGNIRELENAIFRAIVLCDGDELVADDFPQIASQMPNFELTNEFEGSVPNAASEYAMTQHEVSMETPHDVKFLAPEPLENNAAEISDITKIFEEKMPDTGMFGMVNLVSDQGQARTLNEIEAEAIRFAIEIYNGRMSEIARRLGIGRSTLYRKLKEYGLEDVDDDTDDVYSVI